MKLIIQIPCFNEEKTIGATIKDLPTQIDGMDTIEYLVIDDGCSDNTVAIAKQAGVHHIVSHTQNQGLAATFMTGLDTAISLGADIIVNTDADNQYDASYIKDLVEPILANEAEIVIGARPIQSINDFSPLKKKFQHIGSAVVRAVSKTDTDDAPSGFRAFSKQAALKLNVFGDYTYTLETVIQAGKNNIPIKSVPVQVNGKTRESRLMSNPLSYVFKSASTIIRIYAVYKPFKFFFTIGLILFSLGTLIGVRYLIIGGQGHIQSLILGAILMVSGFQAFIAAFIADFIAANRKILEEIRFRERANSIDLSKSD